MGSIVCDHVKHADAMPKDILNKVNNLKKAFGKANDEVNPLQGYKCSVLKLHQNPPKPSKTLQNPPKPSKTLQNPPKPSKTLQIHFNPLPSQKFE
jgi:hypothetical protein